MCAAPRFILTLFVFFFWYLLEGEGFKRERRGGGSGREGEGRRLKWLDWRERGRVRAAPRASTWWAPAHRDDEISPPPSQLS